MQKITANDPESKSADIIAENIDQLKALFPEAFTEGMVDFEALKQLLGGVVDDKEEKYGLNWHGKRQARRIALTPSTGTLRPCPEDSVDWDTTQNLMIEGDNLEVLKLLQKSYAGKVKMIYIDPPYNTGKDFVYPDNFQDNIKNYLELTGQTDEAGKKLSSNSEASGRFHTDWLNMMYPRLKLARNLLKDNGAIFISIDDGELKTLLAVCDDIFGEENYVGTIARKTKLTSNKGTHFAPSHEYIVVYARALDELDEFNDPEAQEDANYIKLFRFSDARGKYNEVSLYMPSLDARANQRYYIQCPDGSFVIPPGITMPNTVIDGASVKPDSTDKVWRWTYDTFKKKLNENRVIFKETSTSPLIDHKHNQSKWNIYTKIYLHERQESGLRPLTFFDKYPNSAASKLLIKMGLPFDFSKPYELILWIIKICGVKECDIICDFFAGSGTTGHAAMAYAADGYGICRYVLVQLPEILDLISKDQKAGADFCVNLSRPKNIAELTKERLRRAGKKIKGENPLFHGDVGFRVFKLDSSNIHAWEPDRHNLEESLQASIEHLKSDRTEQDILFELLIKLGLDLTVPIVVKSVAGKTVHSVGAGSLLVCLATHITAAEVDPLALGIVSWHEEQNPAGETNVVFRDSAFSDDVTKTNLTAILQQHGLDNVRSI